MNKSVDNIESARFFIHMTMPRPATSQISRKAGGASKFCIWKSGGGFVPEIVAKSSGAR